MVLDDALKQILRVHLLKLLPSVCSADPAVLADYIIALLLKKNTASAELKASCVDQLRDFLHDQTAGFVETLFAFIFEQKQILHDNREREHHRRRSLSRDRGHHRDRRKPSSRHTHPDHDRPARRRNRRSHSPPSRHHHQHHSSSSHQRRRSRSRTPPPPPSRRSGNAPAPPPPRRSDNEYDPDNPGISALMFPGEPNFEPPQSSSSSSSTLGSSAAAAFPTLGGFDAASMVGGMGGMNPMFMPGLSAMNALNAMNPAMGMSPMAGLMGGPQSMMHNHHHHQQQQQQQAQHFMQPRQQQRRPPPQRHRNQNHNRHPKPVTVIVKNVPAELNVAALLREHFEQFGAVVNIRCVPPQRCAFVRFGSSDVAKKALASPQAVLGNRFIDVFVAAHRDQPPPNRPAQQPVIVKKPVAPRPVSVPKQAAPVRRPKQTASKAQINQKLMALEHKKHDLLLLQVKQQKTILDRLAKKGKHFDPAEKAEAIKRINELSVQVKASVARRQELLKKFQAIKKTTANAQIPATMLPAKHGNGNSHAESAQRERIVKASLDQELDNMIVPPPPPPQSSSSFPSSSSSSLDDELAKAEQEAASLGLLDSNGHLTQAAHHHPNHHAHQSPHHPVKKQQTVLPQNHGRLSAQAQADANKPTFVKLMAVPAQFRDQQRIRTHFAPVASLTDVRFCHDDPTSIVLQFPTRRDAQNAVIKGHTIDGVRLKMTWYKPTPAVVVKLVNPVDSTASDHDDDDDDDDGERERSWKR